MDHIDGRAGLMTPAEKRILRDAIKTVVHHNPHAWWELKRQIFDWGHQSYYPRQDDFLATAERSVRLLSAEAKQQLHELQVRQRPGHTETTDEMLVKAYAPLVVEEVVRRATIAAHRTINW